MVAEGFNPRIGCVPEKGESHYVPGTGEEMGRKRTISSPVPGTFTQFGDALPRLCAVDKMRHPTYTNDLKALRDTLATVTQLPPRRLRPSVVPHRSSVVALPLFTLSTLSILETKQP